MNNLSFIREKNYWVLTSCPSTGDEVVGSGWEKNFSTPVGQARWWKCPACDGWHIMTEYDAYQKDKAPIKLGPTISYDKELGRSFEESL